MRRIWIALAVFLTVEAALWAGVRMRLQFIDSGDGSQEFGYLYIEGRNVRVDGELDSSGDPETTLLYDSDSDTLLLVDHLEESYSQLDRKALQNLVQQLEAQLRQMPEDQRRVLEEDMKRSREEKSSQKLEVRPLGTEGEWQRFEVYQGSRKYSDLWVAGADAYGLSEKDFEALQSFAGFYKRLNDAMAGHPFFSQGFAPMEAFLHVPGVPVRIISAEGAEARISPAEPHDFPKGFFQVPPDYEKITAWQ